MQTGNGRLHHRASLRFAGVECSFSSDSPEARDTLCPWISSSAAAPDFTLRVHNVNCSPEMAPTHFRGMEHLVIARYGANVLLFDLLRKNVDAWIAASLISNLTLWNERFIPLILGVMGCAVGVLPLHSACVVKDGRGVLLAGQSMAGKSTLSVALAKHGYEFLSDDWVYVRLAPSGLVVHGLNAPVKLLEDAHIFFSELDPSSAAPTANCEIGYEVSASSKLGLKVARTCLPAALFFIERIQPSTATLVQVSPAYTREYLEHSVECLPSSLIEIKATRETIIDRVSHLPARRFRYSGPPNCGAVELSRFLEQIFEVVR